MKKGIYLSVMATALIVVGCSDNQAEETNGGTNTAVALRAEVLTDVSVDVITATYLDLYTQSGLLLNAVNAFEIGDESQLTTIKEAWQNTRAPWEKSEGFLYGPVDTEGIDPAIDSWPVDVNAINTILESGVAITENLLESNNEARGFHTIEYFIWGLQGDKAADVLTERELEYLVAAATNLRSKTEELYLGWAASGGNFAANFGQAGGSGSIYISQKSALQEIVEGMVLIADEVANGKIEEPLNGNGGSARPEAEESRFSNNSKLDFANNIRSIQNIYLGTYDVDGKGISDIVLEVDAALDAEIKTAIAMSITAIEAIEGTFTEAIFNDRNGVEAAQAKISELMTLLNSKLLPMISNL